MRPEYIMYGCIAAFFILLLTAFVIYLREGRLLKLMEWERKEIELQHKREIQDILYRRNQREKQYGRNHTAATEMEMDGQHE